MANLVGTSNDPGVAAVFGEHTAGAAALIGQSNTGRGVLGISESGQGVFGVSVASAGVVGESKGSVGVKGVSVDGRGTEGVSVGGEGVVGFSENSTGVMGQADGAGIGVVGTSKSGVGVFGKGARLAGLFEGKVDITEDLTVRGVSIHALLQRIVKLEETVAIFLSNPTGTATPPTMPVISVSREGSGAESFFIIEGSGFLASKTVNIRVVDDTLQSLTFPHTADANGKINVRQSISCTSGLALHFSATDSRPNPGDMTGVLFSNTFTTTCP